MVNSIGLLEDGDLEASSPGRPRFDKLYDGSSETETQPKRDEEDRIKRMARRK